MTTGRWSPSTRQCREFRPDHLVVATHPEDRSTWLRHDVVDEARKRHPDLEVEHVVVEPVEVD